jgi:hypothetical protein
MNTNLVAARAQVAERRDRYESEAVLQRLLREDRRRRLDTQRSRRRDRHAWFRLRSRAA